jgi:predicted RNase H-like HicB family nuclease
MGIELWMSVKIKDIKTKMIKEDDGSYSITCSALGVYSSGKNKQEAKKNFVNALELHLSVLREMATKAITV